MCSYKYKISVLVIMVVFIVGCASTYHEFLFLEPNNNECISFIQYDSFFKDPMSKGVYIKWGKHVYGIPKDDYILIKYSEYPFYIKFHDNKVIIRFPGVEIIEDKLKSSHIDFKNEFTEEEKSKYGYHKNRQEFYCNLEEDYKVLFTSDLAKNWNTKPFWKKNSNVITYPR